MPPGQLKRNLSTSVYGRSTVLQTIIECRRGVLNFVIENDARKPERRVRATFVYDTITSIDGANNISPRSARARFLRRVFSFGPPVTRRRSICVRRGDDSRPVRRPIRAIESTS